MIDLALHLTGPSNTLQCTVSNVLHRGLYTIHFDFIRRRLLKILSNTNQTKWIRYFDNIYLTYLSLDKIVAILEKINFSESFKGNWLGFRNIFVDSFFFFFGGGGVSRTNMSFSDAPFEKNGLNRIMACIGNHNHFMRNIITHLCHRLNSVWSKPPSKLGHRWVITPLYLM